MYIITTYVSMLAGYIELQVCMNNCSYQGLLAFLINNYVILIDLVNVLTSLQVHSKHGQVDFDILATECLWF